MAFQIKPLNPQTYRRETRRATLVIALIFLVSAVGLSILATGLFGEPGGDNFRWNLGGVVAGLLLTAALVRTTFCAQPWMAASVYGWQLKRSLMSITNAMHQVEAGVAAGDPSAMKLLRFYHLGLTQMHQLDGNSSALAQMTRDIDRHREAMEARGMDTEQPRLEPTWLEAVKQA